MIPEALFILFTKYPTPGKVKTRLIPVLGRDGAASIQREMTQHAFSVLRLAARKSGAKLEVWYDGADDQRMCQFLGLSVSYRRQHGVTLGHRMKRAFESAFERGAKRTVLVGSDCPDISPEILLRAMGRLTRRDLVIGPALDGGYYLVGLCKPRFEIFDDIPWGTSNVLAKTRARAQECGATLGLVDALGDVDRPEDLHIWHRVSKDPP